MFEIVVSDPIKQEDRVQVSSCFSKRHSLSVPLSAASIAASAQSN